MQLKQCIRLQKLKKQLVKIRIELKTLGVIRFESIGGYISKGFSSDKIFIYIGDKLDVIENIIKEMLCLHWLGKY